MLQLSNVSHLLCEGQSDISHSDITAGKQMSITERLLMWYDKEVGLTSSLLFPADLAHRQRNMIDLH